MSKSRDLTLKFQRKYKFILYIFGLQLRDWMK